MLPIKQALHNYCLKHVASSINAARQTIEDAREASRNETKSSAGDKYETAREMMQQEIDMATQRIATLQQLKAVLDQIDPGDASDTIHTGSLVLTNQGRYYIAVSLGKATIDGDECYLLSVASPLGKLLTGRKATDSFTFNGKEFVITEVL